MFKLAHRSRLPSDERGYTLERQERQCRHAGHSVWFPRLVLNRATTRVVAQDIIVSAFSLPPSLAQRRATLRRRTAMLACAAALGSALIPLATVLLPLLAVRAWRSGARAAAVASLMVGPLAGSRWIDLRALTAFPALLTGPWIVLLVTATVTSAVWARSGSRTSRDLTRAASWLALVALPCAPLIAPLLALVCYRLGRAPGRPAAANDNQPGRPALPFLIDAAPVSYPPLRSARSSAFD